jgi:glycosyltransferase involved in cell wall biosynthesis
MHASVLRTALVHDWLNQDGGAEAVLQVLHDLFPQAPVYTTISDPVRVPAVAGWDVRLSWMDRLPMVHRAHQTYLPLYPIAWDGTMLQGYDLVVSNKSGFCHGVRTDGARHVCYCLTPTRYVWDAAAYLEHEAVPVGGRLALGVMLPWLRRWDRRAAQRVDRFVAISRTVRDRIARVYQRDSEVIFPPVAIPAAPATSPPGDFHVVLARLVPYKRIDLAVEAFNQLQRRLVVIGDGRDRTRLERLAGPTVEFAGRLPRTQVQELLARSRGLVWPGVEDFGLAPVEAMALGRPVIARRAGGVLDTVVDGATGVFFDRPTPQSLAQAVKQAESRTWDAARIRAQAECFSRARFEEAFLRFLGSAVDIRQGVPPGRTLRAAAGVS